MESVRTSRTVGRPEALALALIHGNVVVSLGATSVAVTASLLADLPPDPLPLFVVFAATLFVYSLDRIAGLEEDAANVPDRAQFTRRYGRPLFVAGGVLYLCAVGVAVANDFPMAEFTALPLVAAVGYSVLDLKRLFLVKNLLVGACWGAIPLGVGVYHGVLWTSELLAFAAFVAATITIAAAVFDLKDLRGDREAGIRTLPTVIGPRRTRVVAAVATVLVGVAVPVVVAFGVVDRAMLLLEVQVLYVLGYVLAATPDRTPLFYGGVIDCEHTLLAAVAFAASAAGIL